MKKKIFRAGMIPYVIENGRIVMMFMTPSNSTYGGSDPQIAKGKQEDDETLIETAIREAEEELGLKRNNILNIFKIGTFLGRTDVYAAKVCDKEDFNEYNYETESVMWLTLEEFEELGRELHREIVQITHDYILKLEEL